MTAWSVDQARRISRSKSEVEGTYCPRTLRPLAEAARLDSIETFVSDDGIGDVPLMVGERPDVIDSACACRLVVDGDILEVGPEGDDKVRALWLGMLVVGDRDMLSDGSGSE